MRAIYLYDYFGNFLYKLEHNDLVQPSGLAIDRQDHIYLADIQAQAVFVFTITGILLAKLKETGGRYFQQPKDLAVCYIDDKHYRVYLIDGDMVKILRLSYP